MKTLVLKTIAAVLSSAVLAGLGACSGGGKAADPARDEYENPVFGSKQPGRAMVSEDDKGWSIILAYFTGENNLEQAQVALGQIRSEGQVPRARIQSRGSGSAVVVGSFEDPGSTALRDELRRIHAIRVGDRAAYPTAFAAPPPDSAESVASEETDLRTAPEQFGKDALYTLQIGVYGRADRKTPSASERAQFHRLAVEAVAKLRAAGDLAFYYDSPLGSTVTVGVFGPEDADAVRHGRESRELTMLRERFPNNLLNGKAIREKSGTSGERLQPSFLVAIPRPPGQ